MVSLLSRDYGTQFCCFYVDTEEELEKLPTHSKCGEDGVSTIKSCAYGSKAICVNGKTYILTGENKWVVHKGSSGSSSGDIPSGGENGNIGFITDDEINSLFNK